MEKKKGDEQGKEVISYRWVDKLKTRDEMLRYIKTAERYWYSDDWFGSEKRKKPA